MAVSACSCLSQWMSVKERGNQFGNQQSIIGTGTSRIQSLDLEPVVDRQSDVMVTSILLEF